MAITSAPTSTSATASHSTDTYLVNAAFLQEIKESNPPLWHASHELRARCDLGNADREMPQATVKAFASGLDALRDLLALQFSLEESYGYIRVPNVPPATAAGSAPISLQTDSRQAIDQHRALYLHLVDLVEEAEELQYRGCDQNCLGELTEKVDDFLRCLTAHERLEDELIRQSQPLG
ncbi:MAG: hypothetical protein AAF670_01495 [Planctomycetota bacterium]